MPGGHGFAPHRRFEIARRMEDRCLLRLESDDETRATYPFDFRLEVDIRLTSRGLHQTALVTNDPSSAGRKLLAKHGGRARCTAALSAATLGCLPSGTACYTATHIMGAGLA
jgi:hypothetical protein